MHDTTLKHGAQSKKNVERIIMIFFSLCVCVRIFFSETVVALIVVNKIINAVRKVT